jgi:hypothetical protein
MPRWADALGLDGAEREEFLDQAALAHCPQRIRDLVESLRQTRAR